MLTLNDGRSELWQWDTGRTLSVDADCTQVHFSNKVFGRSIDVDVVGGVAIIPDILLQTDKDLNVWAFVGTAENGYTKISKTFKVNRRNKPADYVFTPPDQTTLAELSGRLDRIEESQDPDAIKNAVNDYLEQNPVEAPVQSVNGQIGAVELTAKDVGAISQNDLQDATNEALAQAKASGEFDGAQGPAGEAGGFYTPAVTQPNANTMRVAFTPSKAAMPAVSGTEITLPAGQKGDKGDKGENGADGKSAYAYAVEGGYTGTEAEFAAKLAAEKFANPNALTFTGAVTGSYDGSAPLNVEIPIGGSGTSGSEEKLELIESMELSEDVGKIQFTGLNLSKVFIFFEIKGTSANGSNNVNGQININNFCYLYTNAISLADGAIRWLISEVEVIGNKKVHRTSTQNNNTYQSSSQNYGYFGDGTPIQSIEILPFAVSGRFIGAGSTIEIWGVQV